MTYKDTGDGDNQSEYTDDQLLDLHGVAKLLDVSPHTPYQWRNRTLHGAMRNPLPEPDYPQFPRPVWKTATIVNWAKSCDPPRWPPGRAARQDQWKINKKDNDSGS